MTPAREQHGLNVIVSRVLGAGMALALGCMAVGLLSALRRPGSIAARATPLAELPAALGAGDPTACLSLGLLLLLATPAVRVVVLLLGYARRGEWAFAAASAAVLAVLAFSVRAAG